MLSQIVPSAIRCTTPILLAALAGILSERIGVFNIALEGIMLFGAFFAIVGSYWFSDPWLGTLFAMLLCTILGFVFVKLVEDLGAEPTITGIGINTLALGMTKYFSKIVFGDGGAIAAGNRIVGFSKINIPFLQNIPFLKAIFSGYTPLVYITFLLVPVLSFVIYRTHVGIGMRAVGENPLAAQSAGINVNKYRTIALMVSGALCGMAGAHLSLGYVTMFTDNMTNGRGFFAYVAVVFGRADPKSVLLAALVFGLADTLSTKFQGNGIPSSIVLMLPYVVTIIAIVARNVLTNKRVHFQYKTEKEKT